VSIIDISHPISNEMWSYRPEWVNNICEVSSTLKGDSSTVYKFELCSHTGTYIETSQHKFNNSILLENFTLDRFICKVKLIKISGFPKEIKLEAIKTELRLQNIEIQKGDAIIICTGWAEVSNTNESFILDAPFFEKDLIDYLIKKKLNLLGVDTPVIDNQSQPYRAVEQLFKNNNNLLLLAPLYIQLGKVKSGYYFLNSLPLKVIGVSASLCRPVLIENYMNSD
jgi:kynurenine formamidase